MKKEFLLTAGVVAFTLFIAYGAIRFMFPELVGSFHRMKVLKVSEEKVPFYDSVFRDEDYASSEFIIDDPIVKRARPLHPDLGGKNPGKYLNGGPHDILGFRNRSVPYVADVIAIGDSQTYGVNVPVDYSWPKVLERELKDRDAIVYSMATGSWGAVEYFEIASKALRLRPRLLVVAFYSGNDPLESFWMVYGNDRWKELRPDPALRLSDAPKYTFPAPVSEQWAVNFRDGISTTFTPKLRYAANQNTRAVHAGYEIMARVAERIAVETRGQGTPLLLTIIPTKELVYARKVSHDGVTPPPEYMNLILAEHKNVAFLASRLSTIQGAQYVDLLQPLQEAALAGQFLYPRNANGHPVDPGYEIIARSLLGTVVQSVPLRIDALVRLVDVTLDVDQLFLVREGRLWVGSAGIFQSNGWNINDAQAVSLRDLANLKHAGIISNVDRIAFGPRN